MKVTINMPDDIEVATLTLIGGIFRSQISVHAFLVKDADHVTIETRGTDRMIVSHDERKDGERRSDEQQPQGQGL